MSDEQRTQVSMLDFIRAHETSNSPEEVSEKTGLTLASVLAKASKFRNPEFVMVPKLDAEGKPVYRRDGEDGGETTDKNDAKINSQDKAIRIMVRKLDENGQPIVKRRAIDLKTFPRGGTSRLDVDAAEALLAELRGETSDSEVEETEEAEV